MATKRFKGYKIAQPVVIELESPDGERSITAHCVGALPGSVFLELASVINFTTEGDVELAEAAAAVEAAGVMLKVLKMAVVKDEWDAFKAFIDEPENGISVETLSEIAGYIAEQYTGANPQPSPSS